MSNWISVAEALPDVLPTRLGEAWPRSDDVLVWADDWKHGDGWIITLAYLSDIGGWVSENGRAYKKDEVTHWQRLPDPPLTNTAHP